MFNTGNSEFINEFSSLFFISEIANYLCVVGILIILTRFKLVEEKYFIFWCLYFLTPFFGNYVLFDPLYMPDQYIYTNTVNEIRADGLPEIGLSNYDAVRNSVTNLSSIFFSFIPLFSGIGAGGNKNIQVNKTRKLKAVARIRFFVCSSIKYSSIFLFITK